MQKKEETSPKRNGEKLLLFGNHLKQSLKLIALVIAFVVGLVICFVARLIVLL